VHDRIAHVVDERMLRKHVAQQIADRVILVVQNEGRSPRGVGDDLDRVLRRLNLNVKHRSRQAHTHKTTPNNKQTNNRKAVTQYSQIQIIMTSLSLGLKKSNTNPLLDFYSLFSSEEKKNIFFIRIC